MFGACFDTVNIENVQKVTKQTGMLCTLLLAFTERRKDHVLHECLLVLSKS